MGKLYLQKLPGSELLQCTSCDAPLGCPENVISRDFQGTLGPAYLIGDVLNVTKGPREERILITGLHIVCDVSCVRCQSILGWQYTEAYDESQKYKEGKFILEKTRVSSSNTDDYQ